jgi:hypothetical protein
LRKHTYNVSQINGNWIFSALSDAFLLHLLLLLLLPCTITCNSACNYRSKKHIYIFCAFSPFDSSVVMLLLRRLMSHFSSVLHSGLNREQKVQNIHFKKSQKRSQKWLKVDKKVLKVKIILTMF